METPIASSLPLAGASVAVAADENAYRFAADGNAYRFIALTMATSYNKRVAPREAYGRARAAALRAVEIDAELSEAHASLGQILVQFDWDWAGAEKEFRRPWSSIPPTASPCTGAPHCFLALGRFDESARDAVRALDTDPASVMLNIHLGEHYHLARQYDLAIEQHRRALELNPNHPNVRPLLALV